MLGDNIKKFRIEKGLSLNKLAKMCDISPSYLSDLENNKSYNPSTEKLNKLAEQLNVRIEDFYKTDPDEIDQLEEDIKLLYSKAKKLSKSNIKKMLDMIDQLEKEEN
ncbi:helix-turn-helix domain-containing protein [Clostridium sporogenes]|uniref:helix-turn-helix domain-containing protein n=1 Tax=Clostridium sporogenes TaxID=1509 RepID=UPI00024BA4F2|nr:helix-turn-helix transcriptional regulator [Clostridium sporogenes]EHN15808.1 post-exponential-phase responses transcriptional regulator [Clostridium sporogenes PA 3679]MDU4599256.1 helix-turn-helix transcriptional regulator [Clostridium sporogenes]NFH33587.1 helix-turn-helix transcriptional regulator [Clostridium sporogenes]NFL21659.1 helix-turn-helix transcriptional regulator [Clostridium sporogenes]NFN75111.1 helix-turn-helix transcriptional regulator [Clostridium sporogenes]